jgi:hypothetical protein
MEKKRIIDMNYLFTLLLCIVTIAIFTLNVDVFHDCHDDGDHQPVCENCSCIFCASGFAGIEITAEYVGIQYDLAEHLKSSDKLLRFVEPVFDIDQPPRI